MKFTFKRTAKNATRLLLLCLFCSLSFTLFAQGGEETPSIVQVVTAWLATYGWIVVAIWEIVMRAVPAWKDITPLRLLGGLIDILVPNRTESGGVKSTYQSGIMGQVNERRIFATIGDWLSVVFPFLLWLALFIIGLLNPLSLFASGWFQFVTLLVCFVVQWFLIRAKVERS